MCMLSQDWSRVSQQDETVFVRTETSISECYLVVPATGYPEASANVRNDTG